MKKTKNIYSNLFQLSSIAKVICITRFTFDFLDFLDEHRQFHGIVACGGAGRRKDSELRCWLGFGA